MSAIKYKTIPIYYSKSKILYFDTLEDFDSDGFKYLHKTNGWNPLYQFATHKINMGEAIKEISKINFRDIRPIDKLILMINERLKSGNLEFGIPIGLDEEGISKLNDDALRKFRWKPEKANLIRTSSAVVTSSSFMGLVSVGHGLSFIDVPRTFMYDAGGSVGYNKFISKIPHIKYDVVISHMHFDHYKYLNKLNRDGFIKSLVLPQKIYAGVRVKKTLNDIPGAISISDVVGKLEISGYKILTPNSSLVKEYDLNTTSLIAKGNDWVLTGDNTWDIIIDRVGPLIRERNIIVPHHGSRSSGLPVSSYFNGKKDFWVSYRHNVHKMPDVVVDARYSSLGVLNKVKA